MSHYNYIAFKEYRALAHLARRTGESDEVIEEMEYMADYFWRLSGGNNNPDRKRKPKPADHKDGYNEAYRVDRGGEWCQLREED